MAPNYFAGGPVPTIIIEHEATIWVREGLTVIVDGREYGAVKPRSKADVIVTQGPHRIWMASKRVTSPVLAFKADPREEYGFVCKSSGLIKRRVSLHQSYARRPGNRFNEPRARTDRHDEHRTIHIETGAEDWARVLRVSPDAPPSEIRQAYLRLIRVYHPDRIGHLSQEARIRADQEARRINWAYQHAKGAGRLVSRPIRL
jgi:hypothetical protein